MRARALSGVALSSLLIFSSSFAAEQSPLTATQIARLESLCRVWGTVKFFHPWIVAPPDGKLIDWDAALIEAIPLVERASSSEEFREAIDHLLSALNDQATNATLPSQVQLRDPAPAAEPSLPQTKVVEASGKKILIINATDWGGLAAYERKSPGGLFAKSFADAADTATIVFDLRRMNGSQNDANAVAVALHSNIAALVTTDLTLAASRSRFHSGYAPEQGGTSGGYHSGFSTNESTIVQAKPGPSAGKRLIVLTNGGAGFLIPLLAALQSTGQAVVLHHANLPPALGPTYSTTLVDGVAVTVRTADVINADGTIGLTPDIIFKHSAGESSDSLLVAALAIAGGQTTPPPRSPQRPRSAPLRLVENTYPEMTNPNREFRLLGLFRVWNVMHYFFPYKHLMDLSWDSVLTEFIPRFAQAQVPVEYGLLARELVTHLQDAHVVASGGIANSAFEGLLGSARPMVQLRSIGGKMVVIAVDASVHDRVNVGDVVLAVDGIPIAERGAMLQKYIATSTPQRLQNRVASWILGGPPGSSARLKLLSPNGQIREETMLRPAVNQESIAARTALGAGIRRNTPVFGVLPDGYGYFDLERLTKQQVAAAFEAAKNTPALIMDMRGYPKETAWAICARLTDKPMTMAMARRPYLTSPDSGARAQTSYSFLQHIEPSPLWKYTGRVVVLINEDAISQAEHSCLGFEEAAKGRITFIGTPTAGANGDVTRTSMPGGITVTFSGHDVRHADGRQLQRLGIQPDIRVEPTIEGIVAGKDEVLEAAIKFLNESRPK